jgi:hypothetical protein
MARRAATATTTAGSATSGSQRAVRPRRSQRPTQWEQKGAIAGLVGSALLVGDLLLVSSSPTIGSPADTVVEHLRTNYAATMISAYGVVLAALVLVAFVAVLRSFVRRLAGTAEWRWTATVAAGGVAVTMLCVTGAMLAASAVLARRSPDEAAVVALFAAAKILATFALLPFAGVVLANARTIASSETAQHWLVRFGAEIGGLAIIASGAALFGSEWFGPGEPAVAGAWFLVALWVMSVALTVLRGGDVPASTEEGT